MLNVDQESSWPSVNTCKEHQFVKNTSFLYVEVHSCCCWCHIFAAAWHVLGCLVLDEGISLPH